MKITKNNWIIFCFSYSYKFRISFFFFFCEKLFSRIMVSGGWVKLWVCVYMLRMDKNRILVHIFYTYLLRQMAPDVRHRSGRGPGSRPRRHSIVQLLSDKWMFPGDAVTVIQWVQARDREKKLEFNTFYKHLLFLVSFCLYRTLPNIARSRV